MSMQDVSMDQGGYSDLVHRRGHVHSLFCLPKGDCSINFKVIKKNVLPHIVFGSLDIPFFVCIPFVQLLLLCLMCIQNPIFVIFGSRPQGMQYC